MRQDHLGAYVNNWIKTPHFDQVAWFNANIWGEGKLLHRLADDPHLERNVAEVHPDVCKMMLEHAVDHAGRSIPEAFAEYRTKRW